jgi:hypothetical protein
VPITPRFTVRINVSLIPLSWLVIARNFLSAFAITLTTESMSKDAILRQLWQKPGSDARVHIRRA